MDISQAHQQILLSAVRRVIREVLRGKPAPDAPVTHDPLLLMPAGCFVSLHDLATRRLRGCVGRIQSRDPLIKSIHETAANVLQDPRFESSRIVYADLMSLDLEISVLSPLAPAAHPLDFDPPNHGVYLMCCGQTGTFLPQVARQTGWTREQLLARLCTEKMGLAPTSWQHPSTRLLTYSVFIIGPEPFTAESVRTHGVGLGSGNVFHL